MSKTKQFIQDLLKSGKIIGYTKSGKPIYESSKNAQEKWRQAHKPKTLESDKKTPQHEHIKEEQKKKIKKLVEKLKHKDVKKSEDWNDQIDGGIADDKCPEDFDKEQLEVGIKVEMEHTNDRKIATEIAMDHLTEDKNYYKKLKQIEKSDDISCGTGLAGKICEHNKKKLHDFVEAKKSEKIKKSLDFHNTTSAIDSTDQQVAELTTSPKLIKYIFDNVQNPSPDENSPVKRMVMGKGELCLSPKEAGLYNGYYQDEQGQIVEKFDSQTIELIAKNLELKNLAPIDLIDKKEDNKEEAKSQELKLPENSNQFSSIKLKMGDLEIEFKKSINEFISSYKKSDLVRKAVKSWKLRNMNFQDDIEAAKEIQKNWTTHGEEFSQAIEGLKKAYGKR